MPKHTKKRRYARKLEYLQVNTSLLAGALAAGDVIAADFPSTVDDNFKAVWAKLWFTTQNFTVGEGPIEAGIAQGDYTAAEIEECLEANASWDRGDLKAKEEGRRMVRRMATFPLVTVDEISNDGKAMFQKLFWDVPNGETLALWIRASQLLTTGGAVIIEGVIAGYYT